MSTLQNRDYLRQCHKKIGLDGNNTMFRANYYPPLNGTILYSNHQHTTQITNRAWCFRSFPFKFYLEMQIFPAYYNSNIMIFL